jgi:anaerobic magnesium-protoporphyrin IX monomethyl ester cyclase
MSKVLVISPPFLKDFARNVRWPTRTKGRILRPPDWLAYCVAVLEEAKHHVIFIDMIAENLTKDDLKKLVIHADPDFVVMDASTPSIYNDIECAQIVKDNSKAKVIMVGTHVSALPQETLDLANGAIDFICLGEYNYTVRDIVDGKITQFEGLPKLAHLPLIENLDALPFPAWHHLDIMKYFDGGRMYPYIDVITGRGCPHQCSFCMWPNVMFGHKYRTRSIKRVVDEIEYDLQLFPYLKQGEFFIEDDTFTLIPERVFEFCDELRRRNLNITWSANVRADVNSLLLLREMKKSGCRSLSVGFESGDQGILNNIHKGLTLQQSRNFMSLAKTAGLEVLGCFVIGLPGETEATAQATLKFAMEIEPYVVQFAIAMPLPGTEFFEWCRLNGYLKSTNWSDWLGEGEQCAVMEYPGLSMERMNYYSAKGMKDFYLRPQFIAKYLFNSRSLADFVRRIRGGWNYLQYLL